MNLSVYLKHCVEISGTYLGAFAVQDAKLCSINDGIASDSTLL